MGVDRAREVIVSLLTRERKWGSGGVESAR
ncbi:uncharacterized protein G2W53_030804 [Senna tora]|uniref:Uncharacterized protein n=1 Tax=Senna tora TaxID=362788 RepID=A0A834T7R7_9FABA|nr:uncharacterized protein G2W53_030804 [Senna tora]